MVLEGGKFKIFSALRADEKRRSAPGILPPPRKILATPLASSYVRSLTSLHAHAYIHHTYRHKAYNKCTQVNVTSMY